MYLSKKRILLAIFFILSLVALAGCGKSETKTATSDGKNCIECHTSKEKLAADLTANPLPKKEKSTETSGEG